MIGQRLQDPQGLSLERRRLRGEGPPSPRSLAKGYPTLRAPPPPLHTLSASWMRASASSSLMSSRWRSRNSGRASWLAKPEGRGRSSVDQV